MVPPIAGLQMFARYAYPPNLRGYCGPADHAMLLEYGSTGTVDPGLVELAKSFSGPWPYLTEGPLLGEVTAIRYDGPHTDYTIDTAMGALQVRRAGPPVLEVGAATGWSLRRAWAVATSDAL